MEGTALKLQDRPVQVEASEALGHLELIHAQLLEEHGVPMTFEIADNAGRTWSSLMVEDSTIKAEWLEYLNV